MARLPRLTWPGHAHLVRQDCVHGQRLWLDAIDVEALRDALATMAHQHRVALWAYALLPDALELVACPATSEGLARFMQGLSRRYVPAFNRRHGRFGALWSSRYRAAVVEDGEWLLASVQYVEGHALAEAAPGSHPHHLGQVRDALVSDAGAFWSLGNTPFEREEAWRQRLEAGLEADGAQALSRAVRGAWAVGSPDFLARLEGEVGRPASPRPAGRPRRSP